MEQTNLVNNVRPFNPPAAAPAATAAAPIATVPVVGAMAAPAYTAAVPVDGIVIFGQTVSRQYLYIIGFIIVAVVAYFLWNWYSQQSDDDEEDELDNYPPMNHPMNHPMMGGMNMNMNNQPVDGINNEVEEA